MACFHHAASRPPKMHDLEYKHEEGAFFQNFISVVQESLNEDQVEDFSKLKTDPDRIRFICGLKIVREFQLPTSKCVKSTEKALGWKSSGNKLYAKGFFGQAARHYSDGLLDCPIEEGT